MSETTAAVAELATEGIVSRHLDLKGISDPVAVRVLRLEVNQDRATQKGKEL